MNTTHPRPLIVVISHTHWDREWHRPFEEFRLRLLNLVDSLLEILDSDPEYRHYMLDGQTVLLEDILEVRPDLGAPLQKYVKDGRISIGPWYVLQDEFLVSGESLVRNLLIGQQVGRRIGQPMQIGYIPDAFGHVSQIPRILRGFGITEAVLWRGVGDNANTTEWKWMSPGGAEVLCLWLRRGYGYSARFSQNLQENLKEIHEALDLLLPLSPAKIVLAMNGTDHVPPQADLSTVLRDMKAALPDVEIVHTGL